MKLEKKVFNSFMSTLAMAEKTPDEQETTIIMTLGELRQHVQWCQYAGASVDTAKNEQYEYGKTRAELIKIQGILRLRERQDVGMREAKHLLTKLGNLLVNAAMDETEIDKLERGK